MTKPAQPITPPVKAGFVLLALGIIGWLFLGDWRIAVAGLIAMLLAVVLATPTKQEKP
jgi:hypothetical protein